MTFHKGSIRSCPLWLRRRLLAQCFARRSSRGQVLRGSPISDSCGRTSDLAG